MTTKTKNPKNAADLGTAKKKISAKKSTTTKKEEVDGKNLENVKKKITSEKELLYIYPIDKDTLDDRKKFRTGVRRRTRNFLKEISKAKTSKEKDAIKKEANAWAIKTFTKGNIPTF